METIALGIISPADSFVLLNEKQIPYLMRGVVTEFILTFSKLITTRVELGGSTLSLNSSEVPISELKKYVIHYRKFSSEHTITFVTTVDYDTRVAQDFMRKIQHTTDKTELKKIFMQYSNPDSVDSICKIHRELKEVHSIMIVNIEQILARGEKLEDLMARTKELSTNAQLFYKAAKKTNSCCVVM